MHLLARRPLLATAVVLLGGYLALVPVPRSDGHLLSSDGAFYYSYMRSMLVDHDADIANDIALFAAHMPVPPRAPEPSYQFSIGPAILWTPFFLVGRGVAVIARAGGVYVAADGFSYVEEASVALGSILYVLLALRLLEGVARQATAASAGRARLAVYGTFFASSAFYYALFEPTMSHTLEFASMSLLLWTLLVRQPRRALGWGAAGAAAGLAALVRWQNGVFLLLPVAAALGGRGTLGVPSAVLRRLFPILGGFALVALLQCLFWKAALGTWLTVPQGRDFLHLGSSRFFEVLFSTRHGFFSWTPVALVGLAGLACLRDRALAVTLAVAVAVEVWVCGAVYDWWAGDAFGMRRLIGVLPIVALGAAALLARLKSPRAHHVPSWVALALIVWNAAFLVQYRLGLVSRGDALGFRAMVVDKVLLPFEIAARLRR
jgi:hypothetical protein